VAVDDVRDARPPGHTRAEDLTRHRGVRVEEIETSREFSGGPDPIRSPKRLQVRAPHGSAECPELFGGGSLVGDEQPDLVAFGREPPSDPEGNPLTSAH
jgi:hypothetical protein